MYASLYPSIIRQFNIAPHTQIGMVTIPNQVFENENKARLENWTRASEFMENFQSQVWLEICSRWFNLANYTQLYHEIEDFFNLKMNAMNGLRYYDRDGLIIPMIFESPSLDRLQEAMMFDDNRRQIEEVYYKPDLNKWEEWRSYAIKHPNQQF